MTRLLQGPAPPPAREAAGGEATATSDADLIAESRRDPVAFAAVFDRHWAAIHAFCTSRAGEAGEDLAAEAFRIAFDRRASFDRQFPSARPWLYGVASNVLREHFRRSERADYRHHRAGRFLSSGAAAVEGL